MGQEALLLSSIESGETGIENRDCVDRTPLMVALEYKRHDLVKALLVLGADPNAVSDDGDTCLARAIETDDLVSLRQILEAGADIELCSAGFYTPLAFAATRGKIETVSYLLERGANIEARGEMDETPLIEATFFFGHADIVTLLLNRGANQSSKNGFGQTALDVAKEREFPDVVSALAR